MVWPFDADAARMFNRSSGLPLASPAWSAFPMPLHCVVAKPFAISTPLTAFRCPISAPARSPSSSRRPARRQTRRNALRHDLDRRTTRTIRTCARRRGSASKTRPAWRHRQRSCRFTSFQSQRRRSRILSGPVPHERATHAEARRDPCAMAPAATGRPSRAPPVASAAVVMMHVRRWCHGVAGRYFVLESQ